MEFYDIYEQCVPLHFLIFHANLPLEIFLYKIPYCTICHPYKWMCYVHVQKTFKQKYIIIARNNLKTGNFITLVELCQRKVAELRKCDGKIEYG